MGQRGDFRFSESSRSQYFGGVFALRRSRAGKKSFAFRQAQGRAELELVLVRTKDHAATNKLLVPHGLLQGQYGGNAAVDVAQCLNPMRLGLAGKDRGHRLLGGFAFRSGGELLGFEFRAFERIAQGVPELRFQSTHREIAAIGAWVDLVARHASGQQVATTRRQRAVGGQGMQGEVLMCERGVGHGDIEMAPPSHAARFHKRREDSHRRGQRTSQQIGDLQVGEGGGSTGDADLIQDSGKCQVIQIMPGDVAVRAGLAPAGNAAIDNGRVARRDLGITDTQAINDAGAEALHHDLGIGSKAQEGLAPCRFLEIQANASLVSVDGAKIGRSLPGAHTEFASVITFTGVFDLDHLGPQIGQMQRTRRPGQESAEIKNPDARERTVAGMGPRRRRRIGHGSSCFRGFRLFARGGGQCHRQDGRGLFGAKTVQSRREFPVPGGKAGDGEERRVGRSALTDREGSDGNSFGHLHDGEERVFATQVFGRNGNAQHRQFGLGRDDPGEMCRAAGTGDDEAQAPRLRLARVLQSFVRNAVGRQNLCLVRNAKLVEDRTGVLHDVPVVLASHDDADQGCSGPRGRHFACLHRLLPERHHFSPCRRLPQGPGLARMRVMKSLLLIFLLGFLQFSAAICAKGPALPRDDLLFLEAREAFRLGDRKKLERAAAQLRDHALYPYVESYALQMRLEELDPLVVRAYLARHVGSLPGAKLHAEWVRALGKTQRWELFGEFYPSVEHDDAELSCYALQWRARSDTEAYSEARRLWFTGQDLPEACGTLFSSMLSQGRIGVLEVHQRQRLAVDTGNDALVQRLNLLLPSAEQIAPKRLKLALRSPERLLAKGDFKWASPGERDLLVLALWRLARSSPTAAHEFWTRFRDRVAVGDARETLGYIAYQGARRLQAEALEWYRQAHPTALREPALAWKARIGLRFSDWPIVLEAIAAMSPAQAREPAWRYWKARGLQASGLPQEAEGLLRGLAGELHYYGILAAEELGLAQALSSEPFVPTAEAIAGIEGDPAIQRMLKFYELDLRYEGTREWIWAVRDMSDEKLLTAAEFARRRGIFDRAINTADRTVARHDFGLRYMTPFREPLSAAAKAHGLDEALVFALVRQESRFLPEARSRAGAVGLMQLMPPTARWVANRSGHREYRPSHIGIVDVNVKLGAYYLRYVLDRLGGLPALATAAYNAGPSRALNWRGPIALEGAAYVESIPFNETRDYVKKVLANAVFYSRQMGLAEVPLKVRLGVIPPRDASLVGVYAEDEGESAK